MFNNRIENMKNMVKSANYLNIDRETGSMENTDIIKEIICYSYKLLVQKMRIAYRSELSIDNEVSMQLELGTILKTLGHLYEFTPEDKFTIILEKKFDMGYSAVKSNSSNAKIDVYIEYKGIKAAIELKYLKKENGAEPDNRFNVYADLYNLEQYKKQGVDFCCFILVVNCDNYVERNITGKAACFSLKEGFKYKKGSELIYKRKTGNQSFHLSYDYEFHWNKDTNKDGLHFLKLELPVEQV